MKVKTVLLTLVVASLISVSPLLAQFEGQITMKVYSESEKEVETNLVNMYTTNQRIMISGEESFNFDGSIDANGILIRTDMKDFVVMMGEKEALRFTKEELEGMFSMFSMMGSKEPAKVEKSTTKFDYTGAMQTLHGYETTELRVYNEEDEGYLSIWMTGGIDINWGMLAEPWKNVPTDMSGEINQVTQEFKSKNFPLLIEVTDEKGTRSVFEVTEVRSSRIAKDMVEIPQGIELMSLQSFIMKAMMSN